MPKRNLLRKGTTNSSTGDFLPALCIPFGNISSSTVSVGDAEECERFVKRRVDESGKDWEYKENKTSNCKTIDDSSMPMVSMRMTVKGLRHFLGKKGTPRASGERTTAAQRVDALKRVLQPFFGKHRGTSGTLTPGRGFSGRGRRMRVSPWDRVDSPLCKHRGTNSEGCTPVHSARSNTLGLSNSERSEFTDSLHVYTLYRTLRALWKSGARNADANEDISFFEDEFVNFECATGNVDGKGFSGKVIRRVWDRIRGK